MLHCKRPPTSHPHPLLLLLLQRYLHDPCLFNLTSCYKLLTTSSYAVIKMVLLLSLLFPSSVMSSFFFFFLIYFLICWHNKKKGIKKEEEGRRSKEGARECCCYRTAPIDSTLFVSHQLSVLACSLLALLNLCLKSWNLSVYASE